jgi:rhodanese-related sulfurtransferase
VLILFAAAGAYAFDLGGFFGGCGKPGSMKDVTLKEIPPAAEPGPANSGLPANIKPEDANALIGAEHPLVIDIRTAEEHAAGYIPSTGLVMDYYAPDFRDRLLKLDKNASYLIYCRSGKRSGAALLMMKDLGFTDAHDIAGGINAWTAAGLPVVK